MSALGADFARLHAAQRADAARAEELRERATRARLAGAEAAELDAEAERLAAAIRGRARVIVGMIDERLDALAG